MNIDINNPIQDDDNFDLEKSPQDNHKNKYNFNISNGNKQNYPDDNLINNEMDFNKDNYQYPQANKEEMSQNDSQAIAEQERISNTIYKSFLVKVYGILSVQLLITLFFIFLFQKDSIKSYFLQRPIFTFFLLLLSVIGFFSVLFLITANENLGRKVPQNYLILLIITLCMSFICGLFAISYSFQIVFFVVLLTIISSVVITMYAYSTDKDYSYIRALFAVLISQFGGFILMVFILNITTLKMVCCLVSTLIFGIYLVYDTQVILKKYGEVYSVDDYIFASLQIYIDIVRLFLIILATVGKSSKNK
jgi:FtsH-binding integral membrane protein